MNNVINFLDKIKQRTHEQAEKTAELLMRAHKLDEEGANGFRDRVMDRAYEEVERTNDLRKIALNIEHPQQHIAQVRVTSTPIQNPEPVDFSPCNSINSLV